MNAARHPPDFSEARNARQKVRAAGLDPDYWYPVEYDRAVTPGRVVEIRFWNTSIALYRGQDGALRALENRCAHRQLKLSAGDVDGCNLVCAYHGWAYDGQGQVVQIPHELFGKPMPSFRIRSYPVRVRYGLIWIFPGNPAQAEERAMPEIPELEGSNRWASLPVDFVWQAHHSMIIDNVSDFTHEHLHRKSRPFADSRIDRCEMVGDQVFVTYKSRIAAGKFFGLFVDRKRVNMDYIELCHQYPYQWSNTGGKIKSWCFVLPMDERTTRVFFLFYFEALKIPFTSWRIPQWLMTPFLRVANVFAIKPLLIEDGFAVEREQEGYEAHFDAPLAELNPAVILFQQLTIRKWDEHLSRQKGNG